MEVAGVAVERLAVLTLAERLSYAGHLDTAALLLIADASGDERVGLSITDREAIIEVLDEVPDTLAELHAVLVTEHMRRGAREHGLIRTTTPTPGVPVGAAGRCVAL